MPLPRFRGLCLSWFLPLGLGDARYADFIIKLARGYKDNPSCRAFFVAGHADLGTWH